MSGSDGFGGGERLCLGYRTMLSVSGLNWFSRFHRWLRIRKTGVGRIKGVGGGGGRGEGFEVCV